MKFAYSQYNNRILYFSNFYPTLLHFYIITFVMLKIPNNDKFLIDNYGRKIDYLRISVTDRCNLRCTYCMPEKMKFMPKKDILSFDEMFELCEHFIARGIRKIRITGGEPLVRKGILEFINNLNNFKNMNMLDEITLTTNGTLLEDYSRDLEASGIDRINISLDTLSEQNFEKITRRKNLKKVLRGIDLARKYNFKLKINTVVLKDNNIEEIPEIINWSHKKGMDISLIETMPLGDVESDRYDQFFSINDMKKKIESKFTLKKSPHKTSGPSDYYKVEETGRHIGFITPLSNNFCSTCNRIRITCTGMLYMCLGQNDKIDFKSILRSKDYNKLDDAINLAMRIKPEKHEFSILPKMKNHKIGRHMSVTGG